MKNLIILICIILSYGSLNSGKEAEEVKKAIEVIDNAKSVLENINEVIIKVDPAKLFAKVSKVLVVLGPAMMAVSAALSIVAIFLPHEDSAELKAITAGFDKVNRKLDIITSEIKDLKNVVELSNAKSAYISYVTAINSNYKTLEEAKIENTKRSYDYFVRQYDNSFDLAVDNLYDALTGKLGPYGFNLVSLYKDHVKCNPVLLNKFCTMGIQTIIKGLTVEGAYLGAHNLTKKTELKKEQWESNIKILSDSCAEIIETCQKNWKNITTQHFRETYKKHLSQNNQQFADKIAASLNEVLPQRGWIVVSYNDASGFSQHVYSTFYESDKIWNENKIDVTIFSAPFSETLKDDKFATLKSNIDEKINSLSTTKDCSMSKWRIDKKTKYDKYDLRPLVGYLREVFNDGVIYIVGLGLKPGFATTGNTLFSNELDWKCASSKYRILLFI